MIVTKFNVKLRSLFKRSARIFLALWLVALFNCLVFCSLALGQLPIYQTGARPVVAKEKSNVNDYETGKSSILMATKLLRTELKKGTTILGQIEDLVFDLETEHLAVLILEITETGKQPHWNLVPFMNGDRLVKVEWQNTPQISIRPTGLKRIQASELYRSFKEAIYWIEFAKQLDKTPREKFDDQNFQLTLLKDIVGKPIVDKFGEKVGHIEEVAIEASKGTIAYMILRSIDDRRITIPLGAFVLDEKNSRWMIDLAKDQILNFEAFDESAPPRKADSGWLEFVAVKYGRGGLQSKN